MFRRPLFTPTRAVLGLVLLAVLVVGGLGWVSVTALRVEAAERLAAARADAGHRERLALWRLDSHMLSPLGVENNRPFTNYAALAVQAPVILDATWNLVPDPGRVPSPLLSAALPDWMLLHFQIDPTTGWQSPQVLAADLEFHFRTEPLDLPIDNCSPDRADRLADLRRRFPAERTRLALAEFDRADPDVVPLVVPVPLADEPAADKPAPTFVPDDAPAAVRTAAQPDAARNESDRWADAATARGLSFQFDQLARELAKKAERPAEAKGDTAAKDKFDGDTKKDAEATGSKSADPLARVQAAPSQFGGMNSQTANANPFNNTLLQRQTNDVDLSPDVKARKGATDQVLSGLGRSGYDAPQFSRGGQLAPGGGRGGDTNTIDAAKKLNVQPTGGSGGGLSLPGSPAAGGLPGPGGPGGFPGGGGQGGFGGGLPQPSAPGMPGSLPAKTLPADAPTPTPTAAVDVVKELEEKAKNITEWAGKQTRAIQDRSRVQQLEKYQRDAELLPKAKDAGTARGKAADGKLPELSKGGKADPKSPASPGPCLALAKPADADDPDGPAGPAAEAKSPPVVTPAAVRLGPLRPRRLVAADGTEALVLVRAAALDDTTVVYQGVLVDWAKLQAALTALVADLFPHAVLVPLRDGDDAPPERTMTTLPVRLDTGDDRPCPDCGWTPLRFGLVIAWAAAVLAIVATAAGGRAVLAMSDRRVRFASAVTHELRTPLTALQLHLDLLTSGLVTDEGKKAEYLATIAAEADRLNRLVENVLDFARLEKQSAAANARPVPPADVLAALTRTWADRLRHEGFEFVAAATTPPGRAVTIDPRVLEQVLGNLIDNARKYAKTATDRRIWVWATPADGGRVAFEVEDRGPGVPAAERRRIFQPFTRGSGATDTGGAGLGLSLAKQWADLFGGSLSYHPAAGGVGACFRLELPAG